MDTLMRSQSGGGAIAGGDRAVLDYQYYYHAAAAAGGLMDGREMMGVAAPPSAAADDGVVLLMEMLDDEEEEMGEGYYSPAPAATARDGDGDADRLSRVMRSLEAEIGGGASETAVNNEITAAGAASNDSGVAGAISRLDQDMFFDGLDDGYGGGAFGYGWPAAAAAVHEVGGWCVYSDIEHLYFGDGDCCIDEQVYSPLWE